MNLLFDSQILTDKLKIYQDLLETWQKKVNLISPASVPQMWVRHFEDSLQLLPHLDEKVANMSKNVSRETFSLIDLGSGAGFPGLVLAIARPDTLQVTLIESDLKKCLFLENVSRETLSHVTVLCSRIESLKNIKADFITARALAPLTELLDLAFPFLEEQSVCF